MNWEAIGAIGELIGAVGVIGTLAYLAVQIRQSSKIVRSSTRQSISSDQKDIGLLMATNSDARAAALYWLGIEDNTAMEVQARNEMFLRAILRQFENQYHQYKDGIFEKAVWEGYLHNMLRIFSTSNFQAWWPANCNLYSSEFVSFVSSSLSEQRRD